MGNKLYIGRIDYGMREDDLYDLFESGFNLQVHKLNLLKNDNGTHKGAGFVEFTTN